MAGHAVVRAGWRLRILTILSYQSKLVGAVRNGRGSSRRHVRRMRDRCSTGDWVRAERCTEEPVVRAATAARAVRPGCGGCAGRWVGPRFDEWDALRGSARMTESLEGVVRLWGAMRANRSGVRRLGAGARGRPVGRAAGRDLVYIVHNIHKVQKVPLNTQYTQGPKGTPEHNFPKMATNPTNVTLDTKVCQSHLDLDLTSTSISIPDLDLQVRGA